MEEGGRNKGIPPGMLMLALHLFFYSFCLTGVRMDEVRGLAAKMIIGQNFSTDF